MRGIDEAGNREKPGVAQTVTWTVDTLPPVVTVKGVPTKPITSTTKAAVTVGGKDVAYYRYSTDGGATFSDEVPVKTPLTFSGLNDGTYAVVISGRDLAGNWQEVGAPTFAVTIDNEPPTATATGVPTGLTNAKKAAITIGGTDVVAYQYSIDGGAWIGGAKGIAVSKPIALTLKTKSYTLQVIGVDAAGNWQRKDAAATYTWTSDITAPKVVFQRPVSATVVQGSNTSLTFTVQPVETVTYICKLDTQIQYSQCGATYRLGDADLGAHVLSVVATDGANNFSRPVMYNWSVKAAQ